MSLGALTEDDLRELAQHGEDLFVERKQAIPADGIGRTVAAFANSLGGWVLLGITDQSGAVRDRLLGALATSETLQLFGRQLARVAQDQVRAFKHIRDDMTDWIVTGNALGKYFALPRCRGQVVT
jgi:hypothetical protein